MPPARSEVVIFSKAGVSLEIGQVNTQMLTFENCQHMKIVVACTRHTTVASVIHHVKL